MKKIVKVFFKNIKICSQMSVIFKQSDFIPKLHHPVVFKTLRLTLKKLLFKYRRKKTLKI